MDDVEDIATARIGGIPAWGWAVGIVGLVVAFVWWRNRSAAAATVVPDDNTGVSGLGDLAGVSPSLTGSGAGTGTSTGTATLTTQGWLQNALTQAEQSGTDPLTATDALSNFLAGNPLSGSQQSIVSSAIGAQGLPPNYDYSTAISSQTPTQTVTTPPPVNPFLSQIATITSDIKVDTAVQAQRRSEAAALQREAAARTGTARTSLLNQAKSLLASATAEQKNIDIDTNTLSGLQASSNAWTAGQ